MRTALAVIAAALVATGSALAQGVEEGDGALRRVTTKGGLNGEGHQVIGAEAQLDALQIAQAAQK